MQAAIIRQKSELDEAISNVMTGHGCFCIGGKCSNCGECCTDLLPVSERELRRIRQYVARHGRKEHHNAPLLAIRQAMVDMTCPFRNPATSRCDIYEVRPEICRSFICTKTVEQAQAERDRISATRQVTSMRYAVFQNPEVVDWLIAVGHVYKIR